METLELYKNLAVEALQNVNFADRYRDISNHYNERYFDLLLTKIDDKKVLAIFNTLGYPFERSSPGKHFHREESYFDFKFKITFTLSQGMSTEYLGVWYKNDLIDIPTNMAFIYRYLLNDRKAPITAAKFKDYDELAIIFYNVLRLYEDFKTEFIKLISERVAGL